LVVAIAPRGVVVEREQELAPDHGQDQPALPGAEHAGDRARADGAGEPPGGPIRTGRFVVVVGIARGCHQKRGSDGCEDGAAGRGGGWYVRSASIRAPAGIGARGTRWPASTEATACPSR